MSGSLSKSKDKDTIDMCKAIEDMINDSRSDGRNEANIETAKILLTLGKLTFEEIAESTHLSLEKVQELSNHKAV
jgi:predicted transposase YdaD